MVVEDAVCTILLEVFDRQPHLLLHVLEGLVQVEAIELRLVRQLEMHLLNLSEVVLEPDLDCLVIEVEVAGLSDACWLR